MVRGGHAAAALDCRIDIPSPAPDVLHINLELKQFVPFDALPPEHPSGSGPPRTPGSFPPLTKSKLEAKATSYVRSMLLNEEPSVVFQSE